MPAKVAKESVDYGPGHSRGDHCKVCRNFVEPNACTRVTGKIAPSYWCRLFKRNVSRETS